MEEIKEILDNLSHRISNLEFKVANLELKETEDTANNNWIPDDDAIYYFIDLDCMRVDNDCWYDHPFDNIRLNHKVIFKTKNEAVEYLEYLQEKEKHMNTFTEEEWEDEDEKIDKWYYEYDCEDKKISYDYGNLLKKNIPYFKTEEETKDFIKKYEWQIKHELGVK